MNVIRSGIFFFLAIFSLLVSNGLSEIPAVSDFQISISEFPASISVDFGEIARNEEAVRVVAIKNLTGERITLTTARTDCACALAFVKDKETAANQEMKVRLQVKPTEVGGFARVVSLMGEEGSDRSISINIRAKAVPRFTLRPSAIRQAADGLRTTELLVSAHLGSKFESPRVELNANSRFTAECRKLSEQELQVILTPRLTDEVTLPSNGIKLYEGLTITYGRDRTAIFEIPIEIDRRPEVRPASLRLNAGGNIKRFFLFGDFGISASELAESDVVLQFSDNLYSVSADWKNERLCVCTVSLSAKAFPPGRSIGDVLLRLEQNRSNVERQIGKLTVEK